MGFPSERETAPLDRRYVGKFHYCAYWQQWDLITGFDRGMWLVREVNSDGIPIATERRHCTPLHANRFADKPFEVLAHQLR
jgi:hypothetical protein